MKKVLYISLLLLLIAGLLVACSPAAENNTTDEQTAVNNNSTDEQTEDAVGSDCGFHVQGTARTNPGEEEAWAEVLAAFEEEYNCKVSVKWTGEWSEVPQQLQTARMANEPVDISSAGAMLTNSTLARSGVLLDLTDLIKPFEDRFAPGTLEPYTIGGHVWAIPWDTASSSMVYYNKTILDDLGLEEPTSYDDLLVIHQAIQENTDMMTMIHQGLAPWMWPMWFFETFAQTSGNTSIDFIIEFLAGNESFVTDDTAAAFDAIANFYIDGVMTQDSLATDHDGMIAAFAQEKAFMFYGGLWEMATVQSAVDFEIGIFEFPIVVDTAGVVSQHGGGPDGALVIPSFIEPENIPMAVQFLEFVTREENASKIIGVQAPYMPTIASVDPIDDPLAQELTDLFLPHTIRFLDWMWPVEVNDAVVAAIPAVMAGAMTSEEASQSVQDALDTLIAETGFQFDWWNYWEASDWEKVTPPSIPEIELGE
jgi:raffinose/stachyose/melibiose transport system substrate-binding protein